MKVKQLFTAALCCLMATACSSSNDELKGNEVSDNSNALTINFSTASTQGQTRVLADASKDAETLSLTPNKIEIKLTAAEGGTNGWLTVYEGQNLKTDRLESSNKAVTLFDVKNPSNLQVRINHANETADNTYTTIKEFQVVNSEDTPAYGATTVFKENTKVVVNETSKKSYEVIGATVEVKIPTARIELSNIQLKDSKKFSELNLDKIFINNIYSSLAAASTASTFTYSNLIKVEQNGDTAPLIGDAIGQSVIKGIATDGKAYVYSVFPTTNDADFPKITLQFNSGELINGNTDPATKRYAVITKMKSNGAEINKLEAGKIYRLKNISLTDDILGTDINGNSLYAVEVTVTVQEYTFVNVDDIEWN